MKKNLLTLAVLLMFAVGASAQDFAKGDKVLNLGVGFGGSLTSGSTVIPPISASLEFCIVDNLFDAKSSIGIGGYAGYTTSKWKYSSDWGWNYTNIVLGARGAFHYQFVDKLDTYAGVMLGYDIVNTKEYGTHAGSIGSGSASGFIWSGFIGARYYFLPTIGVFAELGYGIAYGNVGVAFKF